MAITYMMSFWFSITNWHFQDLEVIPKYLVAFTVGDNQKKNIDACVKKVSLSFSVSYTRHTHALCLAFFLSIYSFVQFSENFTILLFHYDNRVSEWDEFEWSKRAIHVSAERQTKWSVNPES